jgi:hypothetical protein
VPGRIGSSQKQDTSKLIDISIGVLSIKKIENSMASAKDAMCAIEREEK